MNLQKEFKEETNQSAYDLVNLKFKEYYVEWLEEQIEKLRIGGVSNRRELLIDFKDNYWNDDHEPSRMTIEHIEDYLQSN